jgi:hypothetical protein
MTFEPTFDRLDEAAAKLPGVAAEEPAVTEDIDRDLERSGDRSAEDAEDAVAEGAGIESIMTGDRPANELPPAGE